MSVLEGTSNISPKYAKQFAEKFSSDENVKIFIGQLYSMGFGKIMSPYNPILINSIKDLGLEHKIEILPIVPNVSQFVRDMTNYGAVGAGIRRLKRISSLPGLISLGLTGIRHLPQIAMKDFKAAICIMTHMEMLELNKLNPKVVFLHKQMTDLALANDNKEFFSFFSSFVRKKYNIEPGFMTNNMQILIKKLKEWRINAKYIAAPINRYGYCMNPNKAEIEKIIKEGGIVTIATDVTTTSVPQGEDLKYLKQLGIDNAIFEIGSASDAYAFANILKK